MAYALPLFDVKLPLIGLGVWDLALVAAAVLAGLRPATWKNRVVALDLTLLVSLVAILAWALFGILRGGDPRQALMQLNALVRLFVLYFVIHATFRSARDLQRLVLVIGAAALYRALACLVFFFFVVRGRSISPYPESMTDHHDSALWAVAFLGVASWVLASRRARSLLLAAAVGVPLVLAMHYNDRRIAWVEVAGGLALLYVGMSAGRARRAIRRQALTALPLVLLYVAIGWDRTERTFAPVQQLRSVLTDTQDESNDARNLENRGLIVTLQARRLLGTGFGHEFIEVSTRYSLGMQGFFPNYRYLPHNSLLGLVAFTGVLGFSIIWLFVPASAFVAARAYPRARDTQERALSLLAFAVPFVYSAQAFGDMGLQSLKANAILAASTAVAARVVVGAGAWSKAPRNYSRTPSARQPGPAAAVSSVPMNRGDAEL